MRRAKYSGASYEHATSIKAPEELRKMQLFNGFAVTRSSHTHLTVRQDEPSGRKSPDAAKVS
jgi:hypothetical protein